jgi:hypothetical protein
VEYHEVAQHLFGYGGDRRPETAEVIIRRQHIGAASNVEFPRKSGHGVKDYPACSYSAGETKPRDECRRLGL